MNWSPPTLLNVTVNVASLFALFGGVALRFALLLLTTRRVAYLTLGVHMEASCITKILGASMFVLSKSFEIA